MTKGHNVRTRTRLLVVAVALATVVAGCGSDAVVEATPPTDHLVDGLQARAAAGLGAWRGAVAERARTERLAEIDQLRAEAKVAGEQLRAAHADEAIEGLRAKAKVDGETLRLRATPVTELDDKQLALATQAARAAARLAEIEQLRAEAKVDGDSLRLDATEVSELEDKQAIQAARVATAKVVTVWTEVGPVTVDKREWAHQVAALMAGDPATVGGSQADQTRVACDRLRVVAFTTHDSTIEAGQCPASIGLWIPVSFSIEGATRSLRVLQVSERTRSVHGAMV